MGGEGGGVGAEGGGVGAEGRGWEGRGVGGEGRGGGGAVGAGGEPQAGRSTHSDPKGSGVPSVSAMNRYNPPGRPRLP